MKLDMRALMTSLEVDTSTGCMFLPGKKGRRAKRTCHMIWKFVTGIKFEPLLNGEVMALAHKCDRGHLGCCNITHLEYVTQSKNTQDAYDRGSMAKGDQHWTRTHPERVPRGDKSGARIHPEKIVRGDQHWTRIHPERVPKGDEYRHAVKPCIRQIHELKGQGFTPKEIGAALGCSGGSIKNILRGKHWSQRS